VGFGLFAFVRIFYRIITRNLFGSGCGLLDRRVEFYLRVKKLRREMNNKELVPKYKQDEEEKNRFEKG